MENLTLKAPKTLPKSDKLVWSYKDCFDDYPATKLCFAFLHEDYTMEMHLHEFYEINIIISGEGMHYSKIGNQKVRRGDIFIIPPNSIHGYYSENKLNVYHALFQARFFSRYSRDLELASSFQILFGKKNSKEVPTPTYIKCPNESEFSKLEDIVVNLNKSLTDETSYQIQSTDYVKSYILGMQLIVELCQAYSNAGHQETGYTKNIYECIDYIHNNYNQKIDINTLCKIACMSRTFLFNQFKKVTGQTPNTFLTEYRIRISQKLLNETDLSIQEISERIGYYDCSHFEKAFKKSTGKLPGTIRKKLK